MIETCLLFGVLSGIFEAVIISRLPPWWRLRVIGGWSGFVHCIMLLSNCLIHFGTATGSLVIITAGLASFAVIPVLRHVFGFVRGHMYYPGIVQFDAAQLR